MAKFSGVVGFATQVESPENSGNWTETIVEKSYFGDVLKVARKTTEGESVNNDVSIQHSISIVANAFANEHFFAIRYVKWAGVRWTVPNVEVQPPRLLLRVGEVYRGPIPS